MYLTWEEEGVNVARWLQTQGITGILLKYRTQQLGKSEEEVSKNVNDMLSLIFGGHDNGGVQEKTNDNYAVLSEATPTLQGDDGRQAIKYVRQHAEELGVDPHKIGIIGFSAGGMVTTNTMMIHDADSRPDFAGPIYGVGGYNKLPDNPMPVFICSPVFDLGPDDGAIALYKTWREAEQPAELHFILEARHGEGLLYNGREWMEWKDLFLNFLKAIKMI